MEDDTEGAGKDGAGPNGVIVEDDGAGGDIIEVDETLGRE